MATSTDNIYYFRRYLDDPIILESQTPQVPPVTSSVDTNVDYYRRYLVDPEK